jgi:hypothetical protein
MARRSFKTRSFKFPALWAFFSSTHLRSRSFVRVSSYRCRDKISWFPIYLRPGTASFVGRIPRDQHLPHLHHHHLQHLIFYKHSAVVAFRLFSDVLTTSWTRLYFLSSHGILLSISTFNLTIFPSFPLSTHISSQSMITQFAHSFSCPFAFLLFIVFRFLHLICVIFRLSIHNSYLFRVSHVLCYSTHKPVVFFIKFDFLFTLSAINDSYIYHSSVFHYPRASL